MHLSSLLRAVTEHTLCMEIDEKSDKNSRFLDLDQQDGFAC